MRIAPSASAPVKGKVMPTLMVLSAALACVPLASPANAARPRTATVLNQPSCILRGIMTISPRVGLLRATAHGTDHFINPHDVPRAPAAPANAPAIPGAHSSVRDRWCRRDVQRANQ